MRLSVKGTKKALELVSEFLLDAGVLVFVFPLLDSIVQFGAKAITLSLIGWSFGIATAFLIAALIIGVAGEQYGETK